MIYVTETSISSIINDRLIGKDWEGSGIDLILFYYQNFPGDTEEREKNLFRGRML